MDRRRIADRRKALRTAETERRRLTRRAFPRFKANFEVQYSEGKDFILAPGCEIGEGGLGFIAGKRIPLETELLVNYRLTRNDKWVRLKAIVKHGDGNKIGLQFLNLRLSDRLAITRFVSQLNQEKEKSEVG